MRTQFLLIAACAALAAQLVVGCRTAHHGPSKEDLEKALSACPPGQSQGKDGLCAPSQGDQMGYDFIPQGDVAPGSATPLHHSFETAMAAAKASGDKLAFIPDFAWPPPTASERMIIPGKLFKQSLPVNPSLFAAGVRLTEVLSAAGYSEYSFYRVPDGFALVARMEQIKEDGTPVSGGQRFVEPDADAPFSLFDYIKQLFVAPVGYYRLIVFVVTDVPMVEGGPMPTGATTEAWLRGGGDTLPTIYASRAFTPAHRVRVLIYEFRKWSGSHISPLLPGRHDVLTHLQKAGLYAGLLGVAH